MNTAIKSERTRSEILFIRQISRDIIFTFIWKWFIQIFLAVGMLEYIHVK